MMTFGEKILWLRLTEQAHIGAREGKLIGTEIVKFFLITGTNYVTKIKTCKM